MSDAPAATTWMPLYVADYIKDTRHLSTLEHGAYFLLLIEAWTKGGSLPSDEARIARLAGLTPKEWKASRDVLLQFFYLSREGYRHTRVDRELVRAANIIEQRRAAGKASADARKGQRKSNGRSTGDVTATVTNGQRNSRQPQSQEAKASIPFSNENGAAELEKRMFEVGVDLLMAAGKPEGSARSVLGKWKRDHGAGQVIEALAAAQREAAIEPVSFIEKRFKAFEQREAAHEMPC